MLSPLVEQVVLTALAKDPHQRFGSVQAFATALEQASQAGAALPFATTLPGSSLSAFPLPETQKSQSGPSLFFAPTQVTPPGPMQPAITGGASWPGMAPPLPETRFSVPPMQRTPPIPEPPGGSKGGLSRRTVLAGLVGLAVAGGGIAALALTQRQGITNSTLHLTASATPVPTTPATPTPVLSGTLTIWHNWQSSYLAAKQAIFDAYTKLHPQVTINLVNQNNLIDRSVAAVNANAGPDIIAWVNDSLGRLAKANIVVPLDQYISQNLVESTYIKSAAQAVEFQGHIWGVPEAVEAVTIVYNKALVTADQLPKTTDDLLNFERTYSIAHPGQYGVIWNTGDAHFNAGWFYGFGTYYVHEDGKVGLNTPAGIAAANYIAAFRPYLPAQISYDVANSLFSQGRAAAIINGPWAYDDYKSKAGIDVGFLPLPKVAANNNTPAQPFVGVRSLWVTKNALNLPLAADFLKFYTNRANQIAMAQANHEIPANLAANQDATVQALPAVGGFAAQATLGTALPNTPYMSALWKPVADALTAIWTGAQTPAQAMAAAQHTAEQGNAQLGS